MTGVKKKVPNVPGPIKMFFKCRDCDGYLGWFEPSCGFELYEGQLLEGVFCSCLDFPFNALIEERRLWP